MNELLYIIVDPRSFRLFWRENFAAQKVYSTIATTLSGKEYEMSDLSGIATISITTFAAKKITFVVTRGGWTATRKASWEICMRFADWLYSRVDLSEVNISRIWKFSKDETIGL